MLHKVQISDPTAGDAPLSAPALRAACSSASSSRWRSRRTRRSSSSTSRRPASTRRSRPRCSTSSPRCARSSGRASSSSATTSPSSRRCASASACSTPAASSRRAPAQEVFHDPRHPYTVGLLRCIPRGGVRKDETALDTIPGFLPRLGADLPGCVFEPRCGLAKEICREQEPDLYPARPRAREPLPLPRPGARAPTSRPGAAPGGARPRTGIRSSRSATAPRRSSRKGRTCRPSSTSLWSSAPARCSGSSASPEAARRRLRASSSASPLPTRARALEMDGEPLAGKVEKRSKEQVRSLQIVFQNPDGALNRRHSVRRIVGRALYKLLGLQRPDDGTSAPSSSPSRCASTRRSWARSRRSSPAASSSASRSRARSRASRASSSATSPPRRSTSRCRRRSSTSSSSCRRRKA